MGVLYTTALIMNEITITEVMETQDPPVLPVAKGKKRARNLDPALRTWPRDEVMRKRFRNTQWAARGLSLDLAPAIVHDIDEEGLSFHFWTISQYGSTALHWNVAFDTSCLGGEDTTIFACWLIPMASCYDVTARHTEAVEICHCPDTCCATCEKIRPTSCWSSVAS